MRRGEPPAGGGSNASINKPINFKTKAGLFTERSTRVYIMKKLASFLLLTYAMVGFAPTPAPSQTTTPTSSTTATPSTQTKKEINFSGTHYWSSTPKVFPIDPDRVIIQLEIFGIRVNDNGDGPFQGASVHIAAIHYGSKGYNGDRAYETWTDKDGDKVIWELMDTPPGASSTSGRLIAGTGKYTDWQGTMEYTLQFPKSFPEGTMRGICREVVRIVAPQ
jgi:hypothetical protein